MAVFLVGDLLEHQLRFDVGGQPAQGCQAQPFDDLLVGTRRLKQFTQQGIEPVRWQGRNARFVKTRHAHFGHRHLSRQALDENSVGAVVKGNEERLGACTGFLVGKPLPEFFRGD